MQTSQIAPAELYARLETLAPDERAALVLGLLEKHPAGRLELPARADQAANLNGIDLSPAALGRDRGIDLHQADLQGAQLREANLEQAVLTEARLSGALLGGANLRGANLEGADLREADLAGANLQQANLSGANLADALLEEADLRGATLRFAKLQRATLEDANLEHADCWGVRLTEADAQGARLKGARLREANLERANLSQSDLQQVDLSGAQLQGASLESANLQDTLLEHTLLQGASLADARLQGRSLLTCSLTHVYLTGAWLERTQLYREQLGGVVGEELAGDYVAAMYAYLALERNFITIGDSGAASWAYRKRRRMQKRAFLQQARLARSRGQWGMALQAYNRYAFEQFVEWLCDYGESVPRVLASLLIVYLFFTVLYGVTNSVVRVVQTPAGQQLVATDNITDLAAFSLVAMSTSGSPAVGLLPAHQSVHLLTAAEALLCIALTGLLGFVVGNRIRR